MPLRNLLPWSHAIMHWVKTLQGLLNTASELAWTMGSAILLPSVIIQFKATYTIWVSTEQLIDPFYHCHHADCTR